MDDVRGAHTPSLRIQPAPFGRRWYHYYTFGLSPFPVIVANEGLGGEPGLNM